MIKSSFCIFLSVLMVGLLPAQSFSQGVAPSPEKIGDFKKSSQKAAFLGTANEFVAPDFEEAIVREIRRNINRYTQNYTASDVANFRVPNNPGGQFFKPESSLPEPQINFLSTVASENEVDIIVLSLLRESAVGFELELQLFDTRIMVASGIERTSFPFPQRSQAIEDLTYRLFDYMDREGFVHPSRQGFLEAPRRLQGGQMGSLAEEGANDFFIMPRDLTGPSLAGRATVGGEKTPFWEEWWFWTAIFGGIAVVSGVSYYAFVVQRPRQTSTVNVQYNP